MKKIFLMLLAAALVLSGCANAPAPAETETLPETMAVEAETVTLSRTAQREGKTLTIDAQVDIPAIPVLEKVTLGFDEEALQAAVADLVHAQYPEVREGVSPDGYRDWLKQDDRENILLTFSAEDKGFNAGWCYFEDVFHELNGQEISGEDEKFYEQGHMTSSVPNKLNMTAQQAAEKIAEGLGKYSCFTYRAFSVTGFNVKETPDGSGYYSSRMQPCLDGRPIEGYGSLFCSAHLSADSFFAFQGNILLKETGRTALPQGMSLEEAVADFQENFVEVIHTDALTVDGIEAGWLADSEYDGTWTLTPAWLFYCREEMDGWGDRDFTFTCAYKMDTGTYTILK